MELTWTEFEQQRARQLAQVQQSTLEPWMQSERERKRLTKQLYDQQQKEKRDARFKKRKSK